MSDACQDRVSLDWHCCGLFTAELVFVYLMLDDGDDLVQLAGQDKRDQQLIPDQARVSRWTDRSVDTER